MDAKFKSSSDSNFPMSSGNVTRLLAYKSRFFSLLIVYKLRILAGAIEL